MFNRDSGKVKEIECIRVDGASDEGPSHAEVQFLWTERHLNRPTKVTLVTTRSSGDSFLNHVELQNGCLSRGHANLFIRLRYAERHTTKRVSLMKPNTMPTWKQR